MLRFVFALFAMLVGVLANAQVLDPRLKIESKYAPFYHGVASGDPLEDRVIIWTRVSPLNALAKEALVKWRIATDPELEHLVQEGEFLTGEFRDFTVKVDVKGLKPGTTYYYDFECEGRKSITGRTKTTPAGNNISELRFGVVSCSNYEYGYFNAYRDMVNRNDLDAIIHL
ncbi:MAG: alkaline phosphatase D family protein, partial [Luteibaculum sp.]